MHHRFVRVLVLLAIVGVAFFGAVRPAAAAAVISPHPYCANPESTVWETLYYLKYGVWPRPWNYNAGEYNMFCSPGVGEVITPPSQIKLFDGWAIATIDGIPGETFKAFMYSHVPQPLIVPEGWYIYGYGVDIFYDNGNVNPEGQVCFQLPPGVLGNFELGVFSFDDPDFIRLSNNGCAFFQGGGSFFLLMQIDPVPFFAPMDSFPPS